MTDPLLQLLQRTPDADYLADQALQLRQRRKTPGVSSRWVVFRYGEERCALPLGSLLEVVQPALRVHTLPNRRSPVLLGLANLRGRLEPCVRLEPLLGLPPSTTTPPAMLVWGVSRERFVSPVDGVVGVHTFVSDEVQSYAGPADTLVSGIMPVGPHWVLLLLPDALRGRLNGCLH